MLCDNDDFWGDLGDRDESISTATQLNNTNSSSPKLAANIATPTAAVAVTVLPSILQYVYDSRQLGATQSPPRETPAKFKIMIVDH